MQDADWLRDWCTENVNMPVGYDDTREAKILAISAAEDAERDGISINAALADQGYDSLETYMLNALNARVDEEIANKP